MLPKDFPPWQTVYWWFRRLIRLKLFATIHELAVMLDRQRLGRTEEPSAGVLGSQTVKAPAAGTERGWDGAKRTVGRKRHIAVDADGRPLMVNLTPADISDSAGARAMPRALRAKWPWIKTLFADSAYDRAGLTDEAAMRDFIVEVVRKFDGQTGFQVLPRRWVAVHHPAQHLLLGVTQAPSRNRRRRWGLRAGDVRGTETGACARSQAAHGCHRGATEGAASTVGPDGSLRFFATGGRRSLQLHRRHDQEPRKPGQSDAQ
jgi:transposase